MTRPGESPVKISRKPRVIATASVIALTLALSGAVWAGEGATVGWFLQRIAAARNLQATTPAQAERELNLSGVRLSKLDLDKALTEGDIVSVGNALGIKVTTQNPTALSDRKQAESFVVAFGPELGTSGSAKTRDAGGVPNDASDNGKGKKKGHNKSTGEPL